MPLPVSMRVEKYWQTIRGISCGGSHLFVVCPLDADPNDPDTWFRFLLVKPGAERWKIYPKMDMVSVKPLVSTAMNDARAGNGFRRVRSNCEQYARTIMPTRWRAHRLRMKKAAEEQRARREMESIPTFGMF